MKKFLSLVLTFLIIAVGLTPTVFADDEVRLTLDVNQRYTDISEKPEDDIYLNNPQLEKEKEAMQNRKIIYIVVLSVLLVVAVVILIYTLKKSPTEDELKKEITKDDKYKTRLQRDIGNKVKLESRLKEMDLKSEEKEIDK